MKLPNPKYVVTDPAGKHKYKIVQRDGTTVENLASVTGVLNIIDKPALKGWAARMAAEHFKTEVLRLGAGALNADELDRIAQEAAGAHTRIARDAADLGSLFHECFEAIIKGTDLPSYPPEAEAPLKEFKDYRLGSDIEIVATEMPVGSVEHQVGGCLDFIGYSKDRGGWGIGDYKTSKGFYGNEYAYQAGGGYAMMVEEQYGIEIKWAEIVRFSKIPPYDAEARPVTDVRAAIDGFLLALKLSRSTKLKLIGEPTFVSGGTPDAAAIPAKTSTNGKAKAAPKKVSALGF